MDGRENLIPFNQLTEEEQKKIASKGGKASVAARREKKTMKETLELLLSMPLEDEKLTDIDNLKNFKGLKGKNITVLQAIMTQQVQKALKGDKDAVGFVRDMVEPKTNNLNVSGEIPVVIGGENDLKD